MASCPVCFEPLIGKVKASPDICNHVFCLGCLQKWAKESRICPVDRKRFKKIIEVDSNKAIQVKPQKRGRKPQTLYDVSVICEICKDANFPETLLLCDCCDLGYHCGCLQPPLQEVPSGQWHCPSCAAIDEKLRSSNDLKKGSSTKKDNSLKPKSPLITGSSATISTRRSGRSRLHNSRGSTDPDENINTENITLDLPQNSEWNDYVNYSITDDFLPNAQAYTPVISTVRSMTIEEHEDSEEALTPRAVDEPIPVLERASVFDEPLSVLDEPIPVLDPPELTPPSVRNKSYLKDSALNPVSLSPLPSTSNRDSDYQESNCYGQVIEMPISFSIFDKSNSRGSKSDASEDPLPSCTFNSPSGCSSCCTTATSKVKTCMYHSICVVDLNCKETGLNPLHNYDVRHVHYAKKAKMDLAKELRIIEREKWRNWYAHSRRPHTSKSKRHGGSGQSVSHAASTSSQCLTTLTWDEMKSEASDSYAIPSCSYSQPETSSEKRKYKRHAGSGRFVSHAASTSSQSLTPMTWNETKSEIPDPYAIPSCSYSQPETTYDNFQEDYTSQQSSTGAVFLGERKKDMRVCCDLLHSVLSVQEAEWLDMREDGSLFLNWQKYSA